MAEYLFSRLVKSLYYAACVSAVVSTGVSQGDGLSYEYYKHSCPELEILVKKVLLPIFIKDPRSPAAMVRLFFHDCQVQGCDGSILLDSDDSRGITSEMESTRNFGIRNRESIGLVKAILEVECPGVVSCADVIVLAAREAVACSGGPQISVPLGRKDSTSASNKRADAELPAASLGVDGAFLLFSAKGMSLEESVAILGAHTLGVGHCISIVQRLYNSKLKQTIDSEFEAMLKLICPANVSLTNYNMVPSDLTPLLFDNHYYMDVMNGRGLLMGDAEIATDPRTAPIVKRFSEDQDHFFRIFSTAFVKLSMAKGEGRTGEIRRQCERVN